MKTKFFALMAILGFVTYFTFTTQLKAQNANPECPPQNSVIWVSRDLYGDPPGESLPIPFESGIYPDDDPYDNEGELNNYLAGVLEAEMGGTRETPLEDWHEQAGKAVAVAARTVAYDWCGVVTVYDLQGTAHQGVDDSSRQHYNPGHAESRAEDYRQFVEQTDGQHLTYNDDVFSLQYRKYVGQETNDGEINPPHKSVTDPVGSPDEDNGTGMGFHSAQHWAEGRHNSVGCESSPNPNVNVGCHISKPSPAEWRSNLVWDYRRILAHYYTAVEFEGFATYMPTEYRWNMLTAGASLDQRIILATETTIPVSVQIQNSSTESYRTTSSRRRYELIYSWVSDDSKSDQPQATNAPLAGDECPLTTFPAGMARIALPLESGADQTVTISLQTPSEPGWYSLEWDMRRQEKFPKIGWCWMMFSQNRWPKQEQRFYLTRFSHQVYLPAITRQASTR